MQKDTVKRILITGIAGFIGYHLTRYLASQGGHQITLIDNLSRGRLDSDLSTLLEEHHSIDFQVGDLTDRRTYDALETPFDHVYLLAGILGVQNVQRDPAQVLRVNTSIIANAFNWIAGIGCGRLLFASTSEAYAGSVDLGIAPVPTDERVPLTMPAQWARTTPRSVATP